MDGRIRGQCYFTLWAKGQTLIGPEHKELRIAPGLDRSRRIGPDARLSIG